MAYLPAVEIKSAVTPQASIIWLYGLGADGNDFVPIVRELNLSGAPGIRFILPHAPMQHVTINGGYVMRAWYDIAGSDLARGQDEAGVRRLQREIDREADRACARSGHRSFAHRARRFLPGRSDRAQTGLRYPEPLAGIVALSSYVPIPRPWPKKRIRRTAASRSLWLTAFRTSSFHLPWGEPRATSWSGSAIVPSGTITLCRIRCAWRRSPISATS